MAYLDTFINRHIGPNQHETNEMLAHLGLDDLETLIKQTVPSSIRMKDPLKLPEPMSEYEYLAHIKDVGSKNKSFKNYIGLGYHPTITPPVILRNVFENPGWYTPYTPYQAEIAQGRLEALLNFQTMVSDLTAMPIANASLLDEGTAAAEAMTMFFGLKNKRDKNNSYNEFVVSSTIFPQTLDILYTRAEPLGISIRVDDTLTISDRTFGVLVQYPDKYGNVVDYSPLAEQLREAGVYLTVAADILSLALLKPPGEWGADAVVGVTQRFGVPLGFGGPHAAFFATKDDYKRIIPGRIIGVSIDSAGNNALRMALQTREQHIRRDKATSNICTAQALLAVMASMYAVYHGPKGIHGIAYTIYQKACTLQEGLHQMGLKTENDTFFDTLSYKVDSVAKLKEIAESMSINLGYLDDRVLISLNETCSLDDLNELLAVFASYLGKQSPVLKSLGSVKELSSAARTSTYLDHPVFNTYHSESAMMRYLKKLENKDLSLVHSMISLGSCTMKLNAAAQMMPVSYAEFANLHPFSPLDQCKGYLEMIHDLEEYLAEITGFDACSLQSNSGAQGEYTGLLTIRAYHVHHGQGYRNIALIPSSAHGTNPASAVMAGMKVVVVACDEKGNIDMDDLKAKIEQHRDHLSALMVTYPSTHGVFEESIQKICAMVHDAGGKVYMDGANMNAQVGLTSPGLIGADVCHLNLHKTFSIPHGGGGPGMGPICCNSSLAPFLPNHVVHSTGGDHAVSAVSAAPWGSASILLISYAYIRLLGSVGCTESTKMAILNANYIKARLEDQYSILYAGEQGRAAHELIVDLRMFKKVGVSAEDLAKRLIDYGFHAPTLSFPVAGTVMIEPTESENKAELDRFCDAMLSIKNEIDEIARGEADQHDNVLVNAPHTLALVTADEWLKPYSRTKAAFPLEFVQESKFWPSVGRVNNAHGDKNLICSCPSIESYQ